MLRYLVIASLLAGAAAPAFAQSFYETYTGWSVPTTPVLPDEERHPSIWFGSGDVEALRAKREADDYLRSVWRRIDDEIDDYRALAISSTTPNTRPIMAKALAFAWIVESDEAALRKAIDVLRQAYDNVPRSVTKEGEFRLIYRATWLQNYLAAYDWVQSEMTEMEDADVRARLIEEAQLIRDNLVEGVVYSPRPHNHRSKPAYALASAALTLSDHERAADWLRHALELSNTVTRYQFSADGVYREGGHYHMYNMVNLIPFLWHYRNVSGVDLFEPYAPGFEWPVRVRMHRGSMPNIEDSYIKPMPTHMVAAAYRDRPTDLHTTAPLSDVLQWSWMNTTVVPGNYTGATRDVIWEIDEFITYDPAIPLAEPDAYPTVHLESGQVAFRDAWTSEQGRYLLFHGVAAADNHNHPDALSYVIESHGALLAVDAGYGPNGFSDSNRSWYTSPEAHNVVTINGSVPTDWDFNEGPTTRHFLTSPRYDLAEMEARIPFRSGNTIRRGIAFPGHAYWVVYDLMHADGDVDYVLNVHGRSTRVADVVQEGRRVTWTTPNTWGTSARLHGYFLATDSTSPLTLQRGATSLANGHAESQYFASLPQRADTAAYLHLLYPSSREDDGPGVVDLSADGLLALAVTTGSTRSFFSTQPVNRPATFADVTTDAAFTWAEEEDGRLAAFAQTEGSRFAWRGRTLLEADSPLTFAADAPSGSIERLDIGRSDARVGVKLFPAPGHTFQRVTSGSGPVSFEMLADGGIRFEAEEGSYTIATSVGTETGLLPNDTLRLSVFPNPVESTARLRYEVPMPGLVQVRVYNVLGQEVGRPVDDQHAAGSYERSWTGGKHLPNGIYLVEARLNDTFTRTTAVLNR